MGITELRAKSILRQHRGTDSWFLSWCGMNLYRGCQHNCAYCDGRAERYNVEGDFGRSVQIKTNALELLSRELDPARRRKPFPGSYVLLGGGVGDAYQPAEARYALSRRVLQLLAERRFPVHVLTKSTLVERDVDLLLRIHSEKRAIVSFSISTADDETARVFEPGVPPPNERLSCLERLKRGGLPCGVFLMPVLPFISDGASEIEESVRRACAAGADFVIFGGLTLKAGRQMEHYLKAVERRSPEVVDRYRSIYPGSPWGAPLPQYEEAVAGRFAAAALHHHVPARIPLRLFSGMLDETELTVVILEHLDYMLRMRGRGTHFALAARSISRLGRPLREMTGRLSELPGVGSFTERLISEILATGGCSYYDRIAGM